jgi:phage N-6-adenine-methyltransferase
MNAPIQKPGKSRQDFPTPKDLLDAIARRFGTIDFDLAARADNTVAPSFYSPEQDSLIQPWSLPGIRVAFLNPEFANIEPWAAKCASCCLLSRWTLLLVPASIGSNWFTNHVNGKALVLGLNPRISFDGKAPYPKDCLLACFGFGASGFDVWRWK